MTYSVLTKVSNDMYKNQKFYMYKHGEDTLETLTFKEATSLKVILDNYPSVFLENEVIPREQSEIKLLDINKQSNEPLDFDFENVSDDCAGIIAKLEENFNARISGIDREETVRQTFED